MACLKMGLMALMLAAAVAAVSADGHMMEDMYPYKYYAYLKGKFQVPSLVTKTWGFGYVEWNDTDIKVSVDLHYAKDIFAAHIHNGTMGVNGPVVIPIMEFMAPVGTDRQLVSGDFHTYVMLKTADYMWLPEFLSMGMAYFNVHSMEYPGGEVRGQAYVAKMPDMEPPMPTETIADVAAMYPELSTFLAAVAAAPDILAAATDPATAVTVLAPNDAAFAAALVALDLQLQDLVGNTQLLTSVLSYHVLPAVIPASGVPAAPGSDVPTLNGATVLASAADGMVMFNDVATVVTADVMVGGGTSIIHIIDAVLLPPM